MRTISTSKPVLVSTLFSAALSALGTAQTVFTEPAGYVKLGNKTPGAQAVPPNTDVRMSIPMDPATAFTGTVASVTATEIVIAGSPNFSANEWNPATGEPFQARMSSGNEEGLWAMIVSHTANTLSVEVAVGDLTNVSVGDEIEILPCSTVGNVFENQDIPPGTRLLFFSGVTAGINISSDVGLVWSGTNWLDVTAGGANADNFIIHPGESFIMRTNTAPVESLFSIGEVPTSRHRIQVTKNGAAGQDTTISYFSPVPEVIGDSNLGFNPGDRLLIYDNTVAGINKSSQRGLIFTGAVWLDTDPSVGDVSNTFTLQPGEGYILRQPSRSPQGAVEWSDIQTFNQ